MKKGIGFDFIQRTKFQYLERSDQMRGVTQPPLVLSSDKGTVIDLPEPDRLDIPDVPLRKAIENRKSVRSYSTTPLSLEELSLLLWCTQGVREIIPTLTTLRTVPSAGARHALETYLLVNRIQDLPGGLYRYLPLDHKLLEIRRNNQIASQITEGCLGQDMVLRSAVTFLWTAVSYRMTWRYHQRGFRYLFLDCGHVCQNLYLAAEMINAGVCAIAAFLDDELNRILTLDGEEQFIIYLATVGKK